LGTGKKPGNSREGGDEMPVDCSFYPDIIETACPWKIIFENQEVNHEEFCDWPRCPPTLPESCGRVYAW